MPGCERTAGRVSGHSVKTEGPATDSEEIAETELQAAWGTTTNLIPFVPHRKPLPPIQPLGETEQLELFAA